MRIAIDKKTISQTILELLEDGAASVIDIAWAMLASKITSRKRLSLIRNNSDKLVGKKFIQDWKSDHGAYKRYHAILSKLRKQGLVELGGTNRQKYWTITNKGLSVLVRLTGGVGSKEEVLVVPGGITIVSYDIPETMRSERRRFRETLRLAGFEQAHQSLWFGNKKVTKQFLDLLRKRSILKYVHIFEVSKMGTLEKLSGANEK